MPLVSVILPTYDRLEYLQEAVATVLAQTCADWELIVVDDGSTDGSRTWVESLADGRIRLIVHEHTGQPAILRNQGLSLARGEWIAFQDSDDRWKPAKLERQLAYHAAHPGLRWSYTAVDIIDATGHASVDARRKTWIPYSGHIVASLLALDVMIALPSVIVERGLLDEVGGFDEARQWVEDQDLWLRLAARAECGLIDEPLVDVRAHRSMTFDRPEVELGFMEMYRSFAERTTDPLLRAIAHRSEAVHAVGAADRLMKRQHWKGAYNALIVALRLQPLSPFAYRAATRLLWRRFRNALGGSLLPDA